VVRLGVVLRVAVVLSCVVGGAECGTGALAIGVFAAARSWTFGAGAVAAFFSTTGAGTAAG
jgi:hypothetical protein